MSVCQSSCLSVHISIYLSFSMCVRMCVCVCLSVCLFVWLSVHQSVCLSYPSIPQCVHPFIRPSVDMSVRPSVCLFVLYLSVCLCVCLFVLYLSVCGYVCSYVKKNFCFLLGVYLHVQVIGWLILGIKMSNSMEVEVTMWHDKPYCGVAKGFFCKDGNWKKKAWHG